MDKWKLDKVKSKMESTEWKNYTIRAEKSVIEEFDAIAKEVRLDRSEAMDALMKMVIKREVKLGKDISATPVLINGNMEIGGQ